VASQPSSDTVDSSPFQGHGPLTHQVPARPPAVIVYATSFLLQFRDTLNWDSKLNMTDEQKWFYEHIKFTRPRYVVVVFFFYFLCFFCGASVRFWAIDSPIAGVSRQIRFYFSRISAPSLTPVLYGQGVFVQRLAQNLSALGGPTAAGTVPYLVSHH
jgi:hypothetical protein